MISGLVNDDIEGEIELTVFGPAGQMRVTAWIDTGFSGFLTLCQDTIARLGLPWVKATETVFGDGRESLINEYMADIEWDGSQRSILVDESEIKPLIGTSLLAGYKLEMEFQAGGELQLEALVK